MKRANEERMTNAMLGEPLRWISYAHEEDTTLW